jgi:hypothetical protein
MFFDISMDSRQSTPVGVGAKMMSRMITKVISKPVEKGV